MISRNDSTFSFHAHALHALGPGRPGATQSRPQVSTTLLASSRFWPDAVLPRRRLRASIFLAAIVIAGKCIAKARMSIVKRSLFEVLCETDVELCLNFNQPPTAMQMP